RSAEASDRAQRVTGPCSPATVASPQAIAPLPRTASVSVLPMPGYIRGIAARNRV
ncbi:MAG: hypothetical protein QOE27_250, partial [Solirubrobacteraceae bacterium]|nr:hypothetical protein [Solirubrobacteraceae bacterium]